MKDDPNRINDVRNGVAQPFTQREHLEDAVRRMERARQEELRRMGSQAARGNAPRTGGQSKPDDPPGASGVLAVILFIVFGIF